MAEQRTLTINGQSHTIQCNGDAPLLNVLRNDVGLKSPKYGCGLEQCGACKVIIDGQAVPSCQLPVEVVQNKAIITLEGLGTPDNLHVLQQAFIDEQAIQCGYCASGMIIAAKALLDRNPNPSDAEIRDELAIHLCRCGTHNRALRAVKRVAGTLPEGEQSWQVETPADGLTAEAGQAALPHSLQQNPQLDLWVRIDEADTVTLFTGKVEIGQGIKTAVAQIGAEELDVSWEQVRVLMADTGQSPNEGVTAGSNSLESTGRAMRLAAAEARWQLLQLAAEHLEAPFEQLEVQNGEVRDPVSGRQTNYWELFGGQRFGRTVSGTAPVKRPEQHTLVGQAAQRLDLLAKVTGGPSFVHDLTLPQMVHGRIVRPPNYSAKLQSIDAVPIEAMPGVLRVVRDGSFLGVIAEREEQAAAAAEALQASAVWGEQTPLPAQAHLFDELLQKPDQPLLVVEGVPGDEPVPPIQSPPEAVHTLSATYCRPYHMHAALGPSAAVAHMQDEHLTVWSHSQGVYPLRTSMSQVLGMAEDNIRVIHMDGAGCYGHNGADDVALDAALLARALPARPVRLQWTRADEHTWEPYGTAMLVQSQASLDQAGTIIDWHHDVYSYTHSGRPRPVDQASNLLAAWHLAEPLPKPLPQPGRGYHGGIHRNADPLYDFNKRRVVKHFVPDSPLRVSSMRGLGAYANIFAIESFMDELALAAQIDPVAFRLRHLGDPRAKAVIEAAASKAGWQSADRPAANGRGRGIAFAQYKNQKCYAAVIVEVSVDQAQGHIQLERVVVAGEAGQIINPDGLTNQLEGGVIQAASWTLKEQVTFDQNGITSRDWESYPILTFPEIPAIETVLLNRPDHPSLGSGEATQGPTAAAIANAVFDATGARLRQIPFTPDRVRAALADG